MPSCRVFLSGIALLLFLMIGATTSLVIPTHQHRPTVLHRSKTVALFAVEQQTTTTTTTVEVCGFKDCKRAGGGPRLEKLVKQVVEEQDKTSLFSVEGCDCQGECGYGPNLVVNGKIVNNVKGKDAVRQALGIDKNDDEGAGNSEA